MPAQAPLAQSLSLIPQRSVLPLVAREGSLPCLQARQVQWVWEMQLPWEAFLAVPLELQAQSSPQRLRLPLLQFRQTQIFPILAIQWVILRPAGRKHDGNHCCMI